MIILGTTANDTLIGGSSDDTLIGYQGSDRILGGDGVDAAVVQSFSNEAALLRYDAYTTHNSYVGLGLDTLVDVEFVQYSDRAIRVKQQFLGENYQSLAEIDSGNAYTTAQLLSVGTDYLISGNISSGDRDFYKLNIANPTDIEIELGGMSNNLSLRLWNDFNNNGVVNTGEYHTAYQGGLAKEYLFRSDRWAGTWYAEIWSPTAGLVSPYQLKVSSQKSVGSAPSTATDLGSVVVGGNSWYKGTIISASPNSVTVNGAAVGLDDNQDWYKFSLTKKQKVTVDLNFADNYGSAWVEIFDANMQRVGIADTATANEQLIKVLNAGNYYLKVFDQVGSSQNKYSLNLQSKDPYYLSFDGSKSFSYPLNFSETAATIAFKFRTTQANCSLFQASNGAGNFDRDIYLQGGQLKSYIWNAETIASSASFNDGEWHDLAMSYGSQGHRLYVDGNLIASGSKTYSDFTWQDRFSLGYTNLLGNGVLDVRDLSIYNSQVANSSDIAFSESFDTPKAVIGARIWSDQSISGLTNSEGVEGWNHLVYTYGTAIAGQKLYLNDALVASGNKASSDFIWQSSFSLGATDNWPKPFKGLIDEVKIFSQATSSGDISGLTQVAAYSFDNVLHGGSLTSAPTYEDGYLGKALKFDGATRFSQNLDIPENNATISIWFQGSGGLFQVDGGGNDRNIWVDSPSYSFA